jgi:prevent-host-death family protein
MDSKTIEELARDPRLLLRQAKATGRPLVVTDDGKPKGVLLSVDAFEQLIHNLNMGRLLLEGEEDIRKGRTQPLDDWWKEFQRANAIPGRNQRRRQA